MIHGYARVSTGPQDAGPQVEQLRAAGCERIWVETASGVDQNRPVLLELIAYARRGDVLTVTAFDRLGRSVPHMLKLAQELQLHGVELRSLRDAIDTTTAVGRCFFTVVTAFAELELSIRKERQETAWGAGKTKGRPLSLSPEQIRTAKELRDRGQTLAEVARAVGSSPSTVRRALIVAALPAASWAGPDGLGVPEVAR